MTGMPRSLFDREAIEAEIGRVRSLDLDELRTLWRVTFRSSPSSAFTKDLMARRRDELSIPDQDRQKDHRSALHGSVDDLARDILALRVCQTPDCGGFGGDRRGASIPRSQSFNADSSRETLAGAKGVNGGVKAGQWGGPSMAAILA
jgi:hypothetical protein